MFRKNMFDVGRTEELCREMDKLANEDHTHHITLEEISVYRNSWWIRSNTASIVNLATAQTPRRYSSSAKMATLFLILVELARILVAFFL